VTSPGPAVVPPRGYLPGDWYVVLGARVVVAVPGSEQERAARAWSLVDAGADADEVLDAMLAGGLSSLPGLALVSEHDDATTRVLLRGDARWTGHDSASGADVATWHELRARDVTSWRLELGGGASPRGSHAAVAGEPGEPGLRVSAGLVRAACVLHGVPAASAPRRRAEPEPAAELGADAWGPEPADHDGMTRGGGWGQEFRRHRPGIPGQPQAPGVTATPVARLVVSHGEEVEVDRVVLVGRAPEARRFTSTEQPRLLTVPSPQQEISSTHLEVRPGSGADHGSAVATDLGSTNGTVLVQPGLPPEPLQPGIAVQLVPGALLDLGDGVSIQVVRG
jgi:hypothetical protein